MTASHAPRPVRNVTVGTGRAVHRTDGELIGGYTLCGSEGRTPGSSRLRTVDAEVTCKRCAAIIATDDLRAETAAEYLPEATAPAGTGSGAYVPDADEVDAIAAHYGVPADALRAEGDRIMRERAADLDALPTDDEAETRTDAEHAAGLVHLLSDDLLDACGTAAPGGLELAPFTTPERITCPACLPLAEAERVRTVDADHAEALDEVAEHATPAERLAARHGVTPAEVTATAREVVSEALATATVERYRAPSGNRDEDRFRAVHPACGWRSLGWHSNRTVEGRRLAERDAQQHRCAEVDERRAADADTASGTDADRVTISARARDLRPGDLVVDVLGTRQYAAFDVQAAGSSAPHVKIWTAVADQERGLPPVLILSAGRELLVSRRLTPEQQVEAAELFGDRPVPAGVLPEAMGTPGDD